MSIQQRTCILMIAGLLISTLGTAQEKTIKRSDLPPIVEKTASTHSSGATNIRFVQVKENGVDYYEAKMTVNGHSKNILIGTTGEIAEIEEQVEMKTLSAEVKNGLLSKTGKGKILKVASLTKHDKIVAYEAQVDTNGKKSEVQVGPDGNPLDHEE